MTTSSSVCFYVVICVYVQKICTNPTRLQVFFYAKDYTLYTVLLQKVCMFMLLLQLLPPFILLAFLIEMYDKNAEKYCWMHFQVCVFVVYETISIYANFYALLPLIMLTSVCLKWGDINKEEIKSRKLVKWANSRDILKCNARIMNTNIHFVAH